MSTEELTQQLLALPLPERVALAEALWRSIDDGLATEAALAAEEPEAVALARARDAGLASGAVVGRTHDQVMEAARRVLECG